MTARKATDAAIADFAESIGLLVRVARASADAHELSWTEASVLKRLANAGPATTAELARAQGMRPQSMRTIVATLEKMGLVHREPHRTDGRQVNLVLTAAGAAKQKSIGDTKRTWLAQTIAALTDVERETLFAAGKIIKRMIADGPS